MSDPSLTDAAIRKSEAGSMYTALKHKLLGALLVAFSLTLSGLAFADAAPDGSAAAPAAAPAPAAPAAAGSAAPPVLPPYFSGANPEGKLSVWPDPTGANAGVWATPAGD